MEKLQEYIGTLTTKGQVTVPVEIRRLLGVEPQDKILFRVSEGQVIIEPVRMTLEDTFGSVTPINRPEDFSRLREIALEEHAQRVAEKMHQTYSCPHGTTRD
jgi:antitoxin PrlF